MHIIQKNWKVSASTRRIIAYTRHMGRGIVKTVQHPTRRYASIYSSGRELCLRLASKSNFGFMWPRSLTFWPSRLTVACPCPGNHLYRFALKSLHSFSKYRVHSLVTNKLTDGQWRCQKFLHARTQPGTIISNGARVTDGLSHFSNFVSGTLLSYVRLMAWAVRLSSVCQSVVCDVFQSINEISIAPPTKRGRQRLTM